MYRLKVDELIIGHVHAEREEESSVPTVDDLELLELRPTHKNQQAAVSARLLAQGVVHKRRCRVVQARGRVGLGAGALGGCEAWACRPHTSTKFVNFGSRAVTRAWISPSSLTWAGSGGWGTVG